MYICWDISSKEERANFWVEYAFTRTGNCIKLPFYFDYQPFLFFFFSFVKSYELINFTSIKVIFSMFLYTKAFLYSITIKRESSAWTWPCIRMPLTLFSVGPSVLASSFWLRYLVSFYEFFENKLLRNIQWKYFFCSLDFWHGFIIFVNFFHSITHKILKRYVDSSFQTLRLW